MAYLKAIKCVKVNLRLLQHWYGERDTSLNRGYFAQNKNPKINYYNQIELFVQMINWQIFKYTIYYIYAKKMFSCVIFMYVNKIFNVLKTRK